ncbi:MAG: nucleotidyl transferase AbiEii/AbiGii toxin family protein [Nanoarchaeota archaeon]|nr:nucleotidyl transferase AbiEii/AbiGii toxin family protein [Nanoarchaeota archaeon]MBU1321325.1 nucleotidyl transferase AbiEii/AbiGii toxin family protein [Nanoarchaeota archaeon]MBU1597532.1 nucleotidyl transferase AbiEii/AbiGii toxin family protein [Nanoarchaeota archaeon]MBU2441127.1 nucleotidyl transferase AbiEii/AbiGii toxin family protein [Nanoarchaeota archaeon]
MDDNKKVNFLEVDNKISTIKEIKERELGLIIAEKGFEKELLIKDYHITILLFLMKELNGLYFKGGTALQMTMLDHIRISEDIDFTVTKPIKEVKKEIIFEIKKSKTFGKITQDKDVDKFTRLIVPYKSNIGEGTIYIDLNERAKLLTKPEMLKMKHLYPNIPDFSFSCLSKEEMIAEKIAAAIGRNKPRDHYDIYRIIKAKLPINIELVKKKCRQSGYEFDIVRMFNKAKTLHNRWNEDMIPLMAEEVEFKDVMKTLAEYFNLKAHR